MTKAMTDTMIAVRGAPPPLLIAEVCHRRSVAGYRRGMPRDDTQSTETARPGRRVALRYWVVLILVGLAAIFVAQNRDRVGVHVLWVTVESPMWFILVIIFVMGLLIGLLLRRRRRT
ncbi:hypothetical protein MFTT_37790 [Mycolicibacterium fortuitum subsp. fortuitum]|nr:hypothetical protein MFTT_37790 [Mycolicibacterium fortuitum subsp. fortuitum]